MRLAFIWNFDKAPQIYSYWRDGLKAAIEEIGKENEVDVYLGDDYKNYEDKADAILLWSDSNDGIINWAEDKKGKKGLILTTNPQNFDNLKTLDAVFCESTPVYSQVRQQGLRAIKAFGTDTKFYTPKPFKERTKEYFYPATFSPWKRQRDIAGLGADLWCIGTVQPDGVEDLKACEENGVNIAKGYFKAEYIRDLYQQSKRVVIPALHGSERTVLEAMACGILPEVTSPQNVRTQSYLEEYAASKLKSPREFVKKYYNERQYADKILGGLS